MKDLLTFSIELMDKNIEAEVIILLEEYFYAKKGDIYGDTKLEEVISDSMDFIELIALLTTRYKISVDPKSINNIRTVSDVAQFVNKSITSSGDKLSRF